VARKRDVPTRHEVTEKVDTSKELMEEKEVDLDKIADDVETVRETLENLDLGGTSEGSDEVENAIHGAEDVTIDEFDREDEELEQIQQESEKYEGELTERSDASESDVDKISDASSAVETKDTLNELATAKEAALREVDFLAEAIDRAKEAQDESERAQQELQGRVHSGGRK